MNEERIAEGKDGPGLGVELALQTAALHGRRVVWRTSSPVCFEPSFVTNWGLATREVNRMLRYSDAITTAEVRRRGSVPIFDLRAADLDLCAGSAGGAAQSVDGANEAAATACACTGYVMDQTKLHPAPATATAHVERMLRGAAAADCHADAHAVNRKRLAPYV